MSKLNGNRIKGVISATESAKFDSITDAIADIRAGKMVIVIDNEDRENEGDIIMAATAVTPADVNFITRQARGLLCAPMESAWLERLKLSQMAPQNTARLGTRFTVSVDLLAGATTGISTADRAQTLNALARLDARPEEFGRPGHIFPLEASEGGTLVRPGHTEAAVDLCRLAGIAPVGALCEILSEDGSMARTPELLKKAKVWGLKIITIEALIKHLQKEKSGSDSLANLDTAEMAALASRQIDEPAVVEEIVAVNFPTKFGEFRLHMFRSLADGKDHVAITKGDFQIGSQNNQEVFTRIHSECLTGDTLGSMRCDCGSQLVQALERIEKEGRGIVLYMRQEGRGIGLANKIKAYALQEKGADTVEANIKLGFEPDLREYATCAAMLKKLGIASVTLMTNNPTKIKGLEAGGIAVIKRKSAFTQPNRFNKAYLETKRDKFGHFLSELDSELDDTQITNSETNERKLS